MITGLLISVRTLIAETEYCKVLFYPAVLSPVFQEPELDPRLFSFKAWMVSGMFRDRAADKRFR